MVEIAEQQERGYTSLNRDARFVAISRKTGSCAERKRYAARVERRTYGAHVSVALRARNGA